MGSPRSFFRLPRGQHVREHDVVNPRDPAEGSREVLVSEAWHIYATISSSEQSIELAGLPNLTISIQVEKTPESRIRMFSINKNSSVAAGAEVGV